MSSPLHPRCRLVLSPATHGPGGNNIDSNINILISHIAGAEANLSRMSEATPVALPHSISLRHGYGCDAEGDVKQFVIWVQ